MNECALCNSRLSFRWTDTHGVGVCTKCGLYRIYHYAPTGNPAPNMQSVEISQQDASQNGHE